MFYLTLILTKFNADVKGLMVYSSLERRAVFEISSGLARGNSLLHDFSSRSIKLFISPYMDASVCASDI